MKYGVCYLLALLVVSESSPAAVRKPPALPTVPPLTDASRKLAVKRASLLPRPRVAVPSVVGVVGVSEFAPHRAPKITSVFLPYELRFLEIPFQLTGGKTYQFESSENLITWLPIGEPYKPPVDESYTRSLSIAVNGFFYPKQFGRMRVVPP